ncbi:MAG: transposase [Pikeienuella sp.]
MKKSRFTEEQVIAMIKEQEGGVPTAEVCRKHGISTASFYKYKSKFGGMDDSDSRKLKALEDKNARLKKLLAEQLLGNAMLKGVNSKK